MNVFIKAYLFPCSLNKGKERKKWLLWHKEYGNWISFFLILWFILHIYEDYRKFNPPPTTIHLLTSLFVESLTDYPYSHSLWDFKFFHLSRLLQWDTLNDSKPTHVSLSLWILHLLQSSSFSRSFMIAWRNSLSYFTVDLSYSRSYHTPWVWPYMVTNQLFVKNNVLWIISLRTLSFAFSTN